MRTMLIVSWCFFVLVGGLSAQDQGAPAKAEKEHAWLKQMVGEWTVESEAIMAPGQAPLKSSGTESVRTVGDVWVLSEIKSSVMNVAFTGFLTLGYDTEKKKFVGSWIDSMTTHLIVYDNGTLDAEGKKLTLSCRMPNPMLGGKVCLFHDVIEIKNKDEKTLTSSMQGDDGKWVTFLTVKYQRKK